MARGQTVKVLVATMLGTMDTNALVPVIALYAFSLGSDPFQVGIIVGLYSAVHAPANLLMGRLVDRIGRRLPLSAGLAWDAVSLLLYSLTANPLQLALVRATHGLGGGLVGPSSMSLIADGAAEGRRGRAMALYGMSIAFAVVIGFGIAGPVVRRFDYAGLFYALAVGLAAGFGVSLSIREPVRPGVRRPVRWARLARHVRGPRPLAGYGAIFSLYFILGAFVALVPLHLMREMGYGPLEVGVSFFTFAVLSLVLHYPAGILADRYGAAVPALLGLAAIACAMALIPLVRDVPTIALTMALFGVGHGFVFPAASTLVSADAPEDGVGVATGLFYAILVAGVAVGAPAMAYVASRTSFAAGIWASAWFALIGIALVARPLLTPAARAPGDAADSVAQDSEAGDR